MEAKKRTVCRRCQVAQPRAAYRPSRVTANGLQPLCIRCQQDWYLENRRFSKP